MKAVWITAAFAALCVSTVGAADLQKDVVVRQGSSELTFSEIDARVNEIPPKEREGYMDSPERIEVMLRQQLLLEQLAQEAEKKGLDKSPEFAQAMDLGRKRVLSQLRLQQIANEAPKPDGAALVRDAYVANPSRFMSTETIDVSHILIRTKDRMASEAQQIAEQLRDDIVAGKIAFADAARTKSDDKGTAERGGALKGLRRGATEKAFEDAAYGLQKPGDIAIAQSRFGYHLIRLDAKHPPEQLTEAQAIAQYQDRFIAEARQRYQQDYVAQLRSNALEADPERVASLRERYAGDKAAAPQK